MIDIEQEAINLKRLILDEEYEVIDKTGLTLLLEKAKQNAVLSLLSADKKFQEDVVCRLVKYFDEFNQIHFSKLESYIMASNFSSLKILTAFSEFVHTISKDEDLVLKACVARSVQHLSRTTFSLAYIMSRFQELKKLDPWLLAELIIGCNWEEGVKFIKTLLKTNYDTSYLFSFLPSWMRDENNTDKISFGLTEWYDVLNEEDKKIVAYYGENYGFDIPKLSDTLDAENDGAKSIVEAPSFKNFVKSSKAPKFESLIA